MATKEAEGKGEALNAEVATAPAPEGETQEEHDAAIREALRAEADALVASAETAVEKQKAHLAGAEQALEDAEAALAALGDE
jgi:hypothetical protein